MKCRQNVYSNFNHNHTFKNSAWKLRVFTRYTHKQTTNCAHTVSWFWVSLFIFLKDKLSCSLSPKISLGKPTFLSFHVKIFRFETTFANKECCKKRKKNKQQPMFNRRCVSTNCYHFLQCLKLTQKWQWVNKITCTPKEERGMRRILKSTEGTANLFMGLFNI